MEFNVVDFTNKLKEWFLESPLFPYYEIGNADNIGLSDYSTYQAKKGSDSSKHPNRHPTHLKDVARQCLETTTSFTDNLGFFDYGNSVMESNYPHYHILQNTQVIRKRNRGTLKSKGSEDMYSIKPLRNYERVFWNGKTFTKEYSRNVRGARNRTNNVSHWEIVDGKGTWVNRGSGSYLNTHFQYIDKILDEDVIWKLANYYGLKVMRKRDTGLIEEFAMQEEVTVESVLEAFDSLM
jgi:hypothetical protein